MNVLAGYRKLGQSLGKPQDESIVAAQDRVWKKMAAPEPVAGGSKERNIYRRSGPARRVWRGSINLPIPVAAAAALIVAIAFFALFGIRGGNQSQAQDQVMAMSFGFDDYTMVPVQDMNDVLHFLSVQENADFMVVRLPEHRRFSRTGEPALINAADYSRTRRNFPR